MSAAEQMKYDVRAGLENIPAFRVCGVSKVISNAEGEATEAINALWQDFFGGNTGQALETVRVDNIIYAVYSDYEGDHTKPYRLTIGYKVDEGKTQPDDLPDGFFAVQVQENNYAMLAAQGPQPESLVETWEAIWQSDLERTYGTDFEVYGPRFFEEGIHEVLVCIGVNL